ncbi:hypothetical protein UlMin_032639 [Ulmus minor]
MRFNRNAKCFKILVGCAILLDSTSMVSPLFVLLLGDICKKLSVIYCKIMSIFPYLEAARPRSKSGIQALCSVHVALEKTKNVLQHCFECSKLYLAITGDYVLTKFEKARCAPQDGLRCINDIILEIVSVLKFNIFALDPLEKQVGDDIIALLQQGRKFDNCNDSNELESFHQAAIKLGITSSRESIVAYILHLIRKYSKLFRNEFSDDNDSQDFAPCSPTVGFRV